MQEGGMFWNHLLYNISFIEDMTWLYLGIPVLMLFGLYISYQSHFLQIIKFPTVLNIFHSFLVSKEKNSRGVKPIHTFFAAVGGCVGIGNIISVCSAVQIGGPGAVFWMWIAALFGMLVKYSEIYLSVLYRKKEGEASYVGGPTIFLKKIAGGSVLSKIVAVLLCLYAVEIYLFRIVTYSISSAWHIDYNVVVIMLLLLILIAVQGGINLVGKVSGFIVPLFLLLFTGMSFWIFILNWYKLPSIFLLIFKSAFSYHAALGGFTGSTMWLAMSHGVRRACYTGDIGIGYAGTIHAETSEVDPARQATLGIMSIVLDTFIICTLSVLLILVTGVWNQGIHAEKVVLAALSQYFSHLDIIWPIFIFLLGYSTLIAFFVTGRKSAMSLYPAYGQQIFTVLGSIAFIFFSYFGNANHCLAIMSMIGVSLLMINVYGMFKLSHHIKFNINSK